MCKAPRLAVVVANKPEKNEFTHNTNISYKCRGKQKYGYSIYINGKWDPKPTCISKPSFTLSCDEYSGLLSPLIAGTLSS